jgi:uncharacterized protein (TIGR02231 family)
VFSTARTARHAAPPVVGDDVLRLRRRSDEDKKHVVVEARDQVVAAAGLDRGTRAVDEMPGVDDGGEPLAFAPAAKVSIPSDGRPLRVEVARASFPAEVALVLYPERAPVAHLRATATLAQGAPLLAGPVTLARGASLVGKARLDYVGAGEPFELGFGPDDAVRVRRTAADERDTTTFTGAQTIERTVKVYLSNLSGEARTVEVTERVPVSELAQVEVSFTPGPWKWEPKYGFARQVVELPAGATRTLTLSYQVKAPAKVSLPL